MEQTNHVWEIEIIPFAGEAEPAWNDPLLSGPTGTAAGLLDLLRDFKAHCDVLRMEVTHIADNRYRWYFIDAGGREWLQEVRIAEPVANTEMNWTVPDFWAMRELAGSRGSMLRKIVELLNAYRIQSIEVVWI